MDLVTVEAWGEEIFPEGVGIKGKTGPGGGGGEGKIRLPAGFVCLQNPYTRWTGAVGCKLIDACQATGFLFPAVRGAGDTCDLHCR